MHRRAGLSDAGAAGAVLLVIALAGAACSPTPSQSPSPSPTATPSTAASPSPTAAPVAGVDWGEPVRLPGSEQRVSAASGVSFGDRIIVAATIITSEMLTIGIWSSADGIDWSLDTPDELAAARVTRLIVGPTGLVLAGFASTSRALTPGSTVRAAMWTSPDGRAWTDVAAGPEFDRGLIADIASSGSELLAIGHRPATTPAEEACPTAMVWRSPDGAAWEVVEGPAPCSRVSSVAGRDG
ncbi:MAG TPA: hypothetical protein VF971_05540, partial [Candidatus Limnocylindrales bacterium]